MPGEPGEYRAGCRREETTMRRAGFLVVVFASVIAGFATSADAATPRLSCANGFEAFAVPQTQAELRTFPRIDAGLNADPAPYTAEDLIALADGIDANHDGIFCLKAVSNLRGSSGKHWAFFYLAGDNATQAS
jgi:hypothetical protein